MSRCSLRLDEGGGGGGRRRSRSLRSTSDASLLSSLLNSSLHHTPRPVHFDCLHGDMQTSTSPSSSAGLPARTIHQDETSSTMKRGVRSRRRVQPQFSRLHLMLLMPLLLAGLWWFSQSSRPSFLLSQTEEEEETLEREKQEEEEPKEEEEELLTPLTASPSVSPQNRQEPSRPEQDLEGGLDQEDSETQFQVERQLFDAMVARIAQLETELQDLRREFQDLPHYRESQMQQEVSAQVEKEVRSRLEVPQVTWWGGGAGTDGPVPETLLQHLSEMFVSNADLQEALMLTQRNLSMQLDVLKEAEPLRGAEPNVCQRSVTAEEVQQLVAHALQRFSEDRTGLVDFALESGGGGVVAARCSQTYKTRTLLSLFGVPLGFFSQSPRAAIQPEVRPGSCWAFTGSQGVLVIRLSMRIRPSAVTLEHVPRNLVPGGSLRSAPKDFRVQGLADEDQEEGTLLGTFRFQEDGDSLQTFNLQENPLWWFQVIQIQVLSNWGQPEYTCLYRVRVHGTPPSNDEDDDDTPPSNEDDDDSPLSNDGDSPLSNDGDMPPDDEDDDDTSPSNDGDTPPSNVDTPPSNDGDMPPDDEDDNGTPPSNDGDSPPSNDEEDAPSVNHGLVLSDGDAAP